MKTLLKYLGVLLVLAGVVILAVYYFGHTQPNSMLSTALIVMVAGFFSHTFPVKFIE